MNARGSTEVIIATIGLSMGVLSPILYYDDRRHGDRDHDGDAADACAGRSARLPLRPEEKQRLEREEFEANGFVANIERILLDCRRQPERPARLTPGPARGEPARAPDHDVARRRRA